MDIDRRTFIALGAGLALAACTGSGDNDEATDSGTQGPDDTASDNTETGNTDTADTDAGEESSTTNDSSVATGQPLATGALVTRWAQDPFSLGSYSFLAVGSTPTDRETLQEPVEQRIFLAGEHTSTDAPATTHGALGSGRRAADQIIDAELDTAANGPVVVIGAGFAGLGAARKLADAGIAVVVLEGRDRIGGRVFTNTDLGLPIDIGASWIHGIDGNPMTDLATAAGAAWTLANGERNVVIDASAETVDEDESDAIEAEAESIVEAAVERAEESDTDVSLGAMIDLELADRGFDDVRLALVTGEIRRSVEHEYAADLDAFSAQWGQEGDDVAGDEVVFNQGYAQIIDYLAAGLDISLGATVTSVTLTEDGVTVAGSHGVIAASAVIVTLPLGVLQAGVVAFDPPLPDPHRTAIARLGMGTLDKVVLKFDRVFWPDVEFIGFTRPDGRFIEWLNLAPATGQPVLMAFTAGQPARDQEALSDEELIAEATAMIIAAFAD